MSRQRSPRGRGYRLRQEGAVIRGGAGCRRVVAPAEARPRPGPQNTEPWADHGVASRAPAAPSLLVPGYGSSPDARTSTTASSARAIAGAETGSPSPPQGCRVCLAHRHLQVTTERVCHRSRSLSPAQIRTSPASNTRVVTRDGTSGRQPSNTSILPPLWMCSSRVRAGQSDVIPSPSATLPAYRPVLPGPDRLGSGRAAARPARSRTPPPPPY